MVWYFLGGFALCYVLSLVVISNLRVLRALFKSPPNMGCGLLG